MRCENCGLVYIRDPETVTVWYSHDAIEQLTEVACRKCGNKVSSRVSFETMIIFKRYNCNFKDFNDRFMPLSEEEIERWDLDSELAGIR